MKARRRAPLALIALLLVGGCLPLRTRPIAPAVLEGWRSEIAGLVVDSVYRRGGPALVAVVPVPADTTCGRDGLRDGSDACASLAQRWGVDSLWWGGTDTRAAQESRTDLLARAGAGTRLVVPSREAIVPVAADAVPAIGAPTDAWRRFRAETGGAAGAVRFSPVGFSRDGRRAVTFVQWACGPTCGHHLAVALRRDTAWRIDDVLLVWSAVGNRAQEAPVPEPPDAR